MSIQNKNQNDICVGDQVRAIPSKVSKDAQENVMWFPKIGTVGTVEDIQRETVLVHWPDGSTKMPSFAGVGDCWYCPITWLEKIDICCANSQE